MNHFSKHVMTWISNFQEWPFPDIDHISAKMMDSSCPVNWETSSSQPVFANCKSDVSNNSVGCEDVPCDIQMSMGNSDDQSSDASSPWSSHEFDECIYDMTTAALPSDEATGWDDIRRMSYNFQDFEYAESNLILDMTESCILLSSTGEQVNTPAFPDKCSGRELLTNLDNSWFHPVTHQAKSSDQSHYLDHSIQMKRTLLMRTCLSEYFWTSRTLKPVHCHHCCLRKYAGRSV